MSTMRLPRFIWLAWLVVAAAAAGAADQDANMPSASGINAILGAKTQSGDDEFLPPDQAFQVAAVADGADRVRVQFDAPKVNDPGEPRCVIDDDFLRFAAGRK